MKNSWEPPADLYSVLSADIKTALSLYYIKNLKLFNTFMVFILFREVFRERGAQCPPRVPLEAVW